MEKTTDVVVVGFGGAGAAAAIEAADAGANLLILEKTGRPGGATRMSAGIVYAAGSSVQRAAGINDSAEEMYSYYIATDNGMKDPALTRVVAEHSAETIDWLIKLGADFPPEDIFIGGAEVQFAHVTPPKPRSHHFRTRPGESVYSGPQLFSILEEAVKARGIEVMLQTSATELLTNSRREVLGVKASCQGGELIIHARKAVILADGGFANNPEMVKQYLTKGPFVAEGKVILASHPGQTGDAIRMAMALGADLCGMASSHANPDAFVPIGIPTPHHNSGRLPSIFVNARG
ncbi:MAG: FAD-dependent oxidoreductase, partial [Dehalococcoidia bacterium]|nr:FAD-dependent oxidoreductase [Dehalococcoidia bacterium]